MYCPMHTIYRVTGIYSTHLFRFFLGLHLCIPYYRLKCASLRIYVLIETQMTINAWKYDNTFTISTYLLWNDHMFSVKMSFISRFEESWPIVPLCTTPAPGKLLKCCVSYGLKLLCRFFVGQGFLEHLKFSGMTCWLPLFCSAAAF